MGLNSGFKVLVSIGTLCSLASLSSKPAANKSLPSEIRGKKNQFWE
jgi:hypothetical protein